MIGEALKRMRGRITIDELATRTGVHKNTLSNYERGERVPEIDFLVSFSEATGAELGELLVLRVKAGDSPLASASDEAIRARLGQGRHRQVAGDDLSGDAFVLIPRFRAATGPGGGPLPGDVDEPGQMAFRNDWLRREGLLACDLVAVTLAGDSMAPTIRDGALALVDICENQVKADGVYVIQDDGHLIVKRLQSDFAGGVFIRSDNPAYREQHLPASLAAGLSIVGRAVWVGGKL